MESREAFPYHGSMDQSLVLNIVSLLLSVVAVVTSAQALRLGRNANHIPIIVNLLQQYRETVFIKREETLWTELPHIDASKGLAGLPEPLKTYVVEVSQYYQAIAHLAEHRIAEFNLLAPQVRYRAIRTWEAISVLVEGERKMRGGPNTFLNTLETFIQDLQDMDPKKVDERIRRRRFGRRGIRR
jgi:hypothetical protein